MKPVVYNIIVPKEGGYGSCFERGFTLPLNSTNAEVRTDLHLFIAPNAHVDILILHWPEWIHKYLHLDAKRFRALLQEWKDLGVSTGIVFHNQQPHVETEENLKVYEHIRGIFDFAIHFEKHSMLHNSDWAKRHYEMPHPLMKLPRHAKKSPQNGRGILTLGHIRHRSEYSYIFKFSIVARLLGFKLYIGRFHDFRDQSSIWNRARHHFLWRILLGAKTIRGPVTNETLSRWLENCGYSLMFRDTLHLNSAIPYTALSSGLIPIGKAANNAIVLMQKYKLEYENSDSMLSILNYLISKINTKNSTEVFKNFQSNHNINKVAASLANIIYCEKKLQASRQKPK